jgi:hypothetical protein
MKDDSNDKVEIKNIEKNVEIEKKNGNKKVKKGVAAIGFENGKIKFLSIENGEPILSKNFILSGYPVVCLDLIFLNNDNENTELLKVFKFFIATIDGDVYVSKIKLNLDFELDDKKIEIFFRCKISLKPIFTTLTKNNNLNFLNLFNEHLILNNKIDSINNDKLTLRNDMIQIKKVFFDNNYNINCEIWNYKFENNSDSTKALFFVFNEKTQLWFEN